MFGIDTSEFLVITLVAVVAIGPKDMPRALRTAGRLIGQMRRMSGHVRSGIEAMIHEAELEDVQRKLEEQGAAAFVEAPEPNRVESEPTVSRPFTLQTLPTQADPS